MKMKGHQQNVLSNKAIFCCHKRYSPRSLCSEHVYIV
ncbi:unnamed protein product [Ixodes persulcatus]